MHIASLESMPKNIDNLSAFDPKFYVCMLGAHLLHVSLPLTFQTRIGGAPGLPQLWPRGNLQGDVLSLPPAPPIAGPSTGAKPKTGAAMVDVGSQDIAAAAFGQGGQGSPG